MQPELLTSNDLDDLNPLQPPDWDDIAVPHQWYLESPNCIPLKWKIGDDICGIGTVILHEDTAWLAHIIVHPAHRNKGLGALITRNLVEQVDRSKYKTIYLIATDLGYPVYLKVGFELEATYQLFTSNKPMITEHSAYILSFQDQYAPEILALDRKISGEGRQATLDNHLKDALVFCKNDKVEGAFFPGLGNGLIIAENAEAGIELMKRRLQNLQFALCPLDNEAAVNFLTLQSYTPGKISRRMRIGPKRDWQPSGLYNRVSGQVG